MTTRLLDPEKGTTSAATHSIMSSAVSPASGDVVVSGSGSRHTPLQLFQLLVGINTPLSLARDVPVVTSTMELNASRARSDNVGLYQRAKQQERTSRIAYLCTSFISNTLYMFQILLAATITALSAYKDSSPVTLTVLGALNTVLAGSLAWQKGQGVPQRYRKAQDQYQALILEIEMAERSFLDLENKNAAGGTQPDPRAEAARLWKLFDVARADQQANYPDLYVSTGATGGKDVQNLTKELEDAKSQAAAVQKELLLKIEGLMSKLEGKVGDQLGDAIRSAAKA